MRLITIIALVWLSTATRSQMEGTMTLCGRRLSDARELLCYGMNAARKRSDLPSTEVSDQSWEAAWPWRGRSAALGAHWARHKRGLVDECCLKPCTISEILSYC